MSIGKCPKNSIAFSQHFSVLISIKAIEWVESIFPAGFIAKQVTNGCTLTKPSQYTPIKVTVQLGKASAFRPLRKIKLHKTWDSDYTPTKLSLSKIKLAFS